MEHHPNAPFAAQDLCGYVHASPSPYHAVDEAARRLQAAGFSRLIEGDAWMLEAGAAHYVIRSDASLIAFRVGDKHPCESGFRIVGAHTDSPNLRLKPRPALSREGYSQLGVEVYGGVLLYTWLDRDLGISGRLLVDRGQGRLEPVSVRLDSPLCRVPSLAIHLDREVNDKGLVLNRQTHLPPVLGLGDAEENVRQLMAQLAHKAGVETEQIFGFDLGLHDLLHPVVGGYNGEFVFSPRLDNQASCHAALTALIHGEGSPDSTQIIGLFDHEEIGSASAHGAAGSFLKDVLVRILDALPEQARGGLARAIAHSFCISADMAHAVHPNYADKHEPRHMPRLNQGPVVKSNVQQRYATDGASAARFRRLCADASVPCQDFVTRTDLACGSTIGPITASALGIATVDVGNPMLSMHSIREMCGSEDVERMISVMKVFFAA